MAPKVVALEGKIVVLGSQGVGKTSLVVRYINHSFTQHASPTIGASFFTCKLAIDNYRVKLQVWDTAGQERFRSMAPMYYRNASAALLVFELTSSESFEDVQSWVKELRRNVDGPLVLCLIGNKSDLTDQRQVNNETARDYATSIGAIYFETSALMNEGIEEAFMQLALRLITLSESNPNCGLRIYSDHSLASDDSSRNDILRRRQSSSTSSSSSSSSKRNCCGS